jgi:Acetyltransferase (GNAT) domain
MNIETRSRADAKEFLDRFAMVPAQLRRDPYRHVMLSPDRERLLCGWPWPTPVEMWLASEGGKVLARLGANVSAGYPDTVFFGFFEADVERPDAALALFAEMTQWARTHGARKIIGPIDFTTWFPYRLRTDRDTPPPFSWEPDNPPQYVSMVEQAGFQTISRYLSCAHRDAATFAASNRSGYERARAAGYDVRSLDAEVRPQDFQTLHAIVLQSYGENFLFEPIDFQTFTALYLGGTSSKPRVASHFIVDRDGKEVAFQYSFRDGDFVVIKTIGALPSVRGHGLSRVMFYLAGQRAAELGLGVYPTLVNAGAGSEFVFGCAPVSWKHTYALFGRDLT